MYLEQIRSFCAVVDQGSYTRAARQLHLTQPAVSQHVRSLERAFAVSLLDRIGGRMRPTEAGEVVYRHGLEMLAQAGAMRGAIAAIKGLHGGRVVVGAGLSVGNYVLPRLVARFRRRHPEVRLDLRVDTGSRILEQVLRGAVDFGIALGYQVPGGVHTEPLYRDPVVLVVAPDHSLVTRWPKGVPRAALASLPLVGLSAEATVARRLCDQWLREGGIEPQVEMEFDTPEPIKRVVAAGMGAALLFYSNVASEVAAKQLKIVEVAGPPLSGQFVLARRPRQYLSPAARALLQAVVAGLQEDGLVSAVNQDAADHFTHRERPSRSIPTPSVR